VEVHLNDPDPTLYVFKTSSEPHVGELSFFRLYSGEVHVGSELYNTDRKITERIGQMFMINGKNRVAANRLRAGDIGAVVKLRDTHTGNTLCAEKRPVSLPKVKYPEPNIHAALKSVSKGDEEKIAAGLATLHEEDPTFHHRVDGELHQTIISGQGELHLQVLSDRLKRRYNVELTLDEPRIPYRETIKGRGDAKYRHKKQTGGAGQFAEVWMRIEAGPRDSGVEFKQSLTGQNVDRGFVPSVEKGVNAAVIEGVLAGYRVTDVKVDFYDGKMHPVDSNDVSFQIAGKAAFKECILAAKPCLLEPIYGVTIKAPDESMGAVLGDLSAHRGKILNMEADGHFQIIKATMPQKELYHYSTRLRSLTGGRGIHSEKFSHYEEMPREMEAKVIAEAQARKEAE
jgi:elongation factor G